MSDSEVVHETTNVAVDASDVPAPATIVAPADTGAPTDTAAPTDTVAPLDTDISALADTVAPAEPEPPQDTGAPADTEPPLDTVAPADTEALAETIAPMETVSPTDTVPPEDPAAPADVLAPPTLEASVTPMFETNLAPGATSSVPTYAAPPPGNATTNETQMRPVWARKQTTAPVILSPKFVRRYLESPSCTGHPATASSQLSSSQTFATSTSAVFKNSAPTTNTAPTPSKVPVPSHLTSTTSSTSLTPNSMTSAPFGSVRMSPGACVTSTYGAPKTRSSQTSAFTSPVTYTYTTSPGQPYGRVLWTTSSFTFPPGTILSTSVAPLQPTKIGAITTPPPASSAQTAKAPVRAPKAKKAGCC